MNYGHTRQLEGTSKYGAKWKKLNLNLKMLWFCFYEMIRKFVVPQSYKTSWKLHNNDVYIVLPMNMLENLSPDFFPSIFLTSLAVVSHFVWNSQNDVYHSTACVTQEMQGRGTGEFTASAGNSGTVGPQVCDFTLSRNSAWVKMHVFQVIYKDTTYLYL